MLPTSNVTTSLMSTLTAGDPRSKGGRPVGSTTKARALKTKQLKDIIEEASQQILNAQKKGKLKCNEVKTMLRDLEVKHELDKGFLDVHSATINTRVYCSKNAFGLGNSQTSPLAELEPLLIDYCLKLSAIGQPLTKDQVMALVSSMIDNQELEEKVIAWKKNHSQYKEGQPLVGYGWYQQFVNRNRDKLRRTKALVQDIQRETWVMHSSFESMYECVYDQMVHAGIAKRLPKKVWHNREGLIMDSEENAFGEATAYEHTH